MDSMAVINCGAPSERCDPSFEELVRKTFSPEKLVEFIPLTGGLKAPIVFNAMVNAVPLLTLAGLSYLLAPKSTMPMDLALVTAMMPVLFFVGVGYTYLLSKLLGGKGTFEATYRGMSYTSFLSLFCPVPVLGIFMALYALYVHILVLQRVHGFGALRVIAYAFVGWLLPLCAAYLCFPKV